MGTINYTTEELNDTIRHTLTPDYFGYRVNDDVADTVVIAQADTYQTFLPDVGHLDIFSTDEFSYNPATGEITYTGHGELYSLVGNVSMDFSVVNTIVHFAVAVNGDIKFESSSKLESITAILSLGLSAQFNLNTDDVITIKVKADKTGTMLAYHAQGFIQETKPSLG